ncbi:MAG: hypothetical protein J5746_00705 [Victivallales bacterium]|nr:hypothetical protein [Victivallales bacterium]
MDNADVIDRFYTFCKGVWASFLNLVGGYADATHKAEFDYDFGMAFMLAVIILFFVGSACWAASIATSRRYMAIPHFLLGLVFPWIYPLVILFALDIKGHKQMIRAAEQEKQEKERAEAERQKNIAINTDGKAEQKVVDDNGFNQARFSAIIRNADSEPGPWKVVFSGNEMIVTKVLEALPELVSVEVQGDGGKTFTMRIPYAKMESWDNA